MALDMTLAAWVRLSTGALLALFGVLVLLRRTDHPRRRPLGWLLLAFGLTHIPSNVNFVGGDPPLLIAADIVFEPIAMGFAIWLAHVEARGDPSLGRRTIGLGVASGLGAAILSVVASTGATSASLTNTGMFALLLGIMGAPTLAMAVGARRTRDAAEARALCALVLGLAIYPISYLTDVIRSPWQLAAALIGTTPFLFALVALAGARQGPSPKAAGAAGVALVALSLSSMILFAAQRPDQDFGIFGIVRIAVLGLLGYAVFGLGAVGESARPSRDRRAALATGFLVVLFITAQVAQNFLSAQYGLVMGGIVAGAFLFAAQPLQRAFEGRGPAPAPGSAPGNDERSRRVYRDAVRHALRDREMSRAEEMHLTELAEELRLPASEALRIRHEVEDEVD